MDIIAPSAPVVTTIERPVVQAPAPMPTPAPQKKAPIPEPVVEQVSAVIEEPAEPAPIPQPPRGDQLPLNEETWSQVLAELKKQYNTIYGIVRMAHLDFSTAGKVTLNFTFAFHQKRISDAKNRKIIGDAITHVTGQQIEVACVLNKEPQARPAVAPIAAKSDEALQDISTMFGGGELL